MSGSPREQWCSLCRLSRESAEGLWRVYYQSGPPAALSSARQMPELAEAELSVDDLTRHFTAHQAPMAAIGRSSRAERKAKLKRMKERKRRILALSWRWSPLSSELVRELFFSHQSARAGEKNSMLRLYELTTQGLLFRAYPDQLPGAVLGAEPEPPIYFPSPLAGEEIWRRYGRNPRGSETVRSLDLVPDKHKLSQQRAESDLLRRLVGSLGERLGEGVRGLQLSEDSGSSIIISAEKIFGRQMSEVKFLDPIGGKEKIRPGGLIWIDYTGGGSRATIPVFLYRDHPSVKLSQIERELRAWQALIRSGELRRRFPTIPADRSPLILFAADDKERLERLAGLTRPQGTVGLETLGIEARRISHPSVWRKELWQPLWGAERGSPRVSLAPRLAALAKVFPYADPLPWSWEGASFPQAAWLAEELEREQRTERFHQRRQKDRSPEEAARFEAARSVEQRGAARRIRELEEEEL